MKALRNYLDKIKPNFEEGGKFHAFRSVFDGFETFLFVPNATSKSGTHIHDSIDSKRIMSMVVIALVPALLFGMYNVGYQHFHATGAAGGFWEMFIYGFLAVLPKIIVSYVVGLGIEFVVAQWKKEEIQEGFLVSGILIPMIVPVDCPLWILAVATAFSVIFAKEVFGGTGMNVFNVALITRAFLFFAYPTKMSGDAVWVSGDSIFGLGQTVDGLTVATPLGAAATAGAYPEFSWDMVTGLIPGSIGETSVIAIALGAIAAATAPAATLMVVRQYKANGPVTRMLLPVVAMDDALGLMLYAIMMAIARTLDSGAALSVMTLLVKPLIEIVGSLAMGVLIGTVMVFCLRFFHSRGNKLTMTILIVFLAVGLSTMLDLSSLLVCMMIGATMINVSNDSPALLEQCDRFTPPLFLLFFVLSGASLDLSVLPTVGVVGIAYVLSRAIGKSLGATIGAAIEKCDKNIIRYLGMTLIPQAGVAIGMARMCLTDLPAYGPTINAVVLAGTLIYELTGPVITKIALTKAGEIKEGGAKPAAVTAAK